MRRSPLPVLAVLVAVVLLLTGCSGGGGSGVDDAAAPQSASDGGGQAGAGGGERSVGGEIGGGEVGGGAEPDGPADPTSVRSGRVAPGASLVRTADLSVHVDDVRRAAEAAARVATGAGGVVEAEDRSSAGEHGSADLTLRVPSEQFDATLGRLADLGEELQRRVGTTDVTEQVVDLDSRIATQRASVARVRALLERAKSLGEVVQVEGELTRRTADLESLEARMAALEGQVELSTITLRLTGDDEVLLADGGPGGFLDGLAAGWAALGAVGRAVAVTAGVLLPFTPLLLLAGALVWRARSRRSAGPSSAASA